MTFWTKFTVLYCHTGGELPRGVAVTEVPRLAWVAEGIVEGGILTRATDEAGVSRQVGRVITDIAASRTEDAGLACRWTKSPSSAALIRLGTSRTAMIVRACSHLVSGTSVAVVSSWYRELCCSSSSTISAIAARFRLVGGNGAVVANWASSTVKFIFSSRLVSVGARRAGYRISSSVRTIVTHWAFIIIESCNCCGAASIACWAGFAFLFCHQEAL